MLSGKHISQDERKVPRPPVSIVIINKNERGVQDTLRLLQAHLTEHDEVIVVDASAGALDDVYRKFAFVRVIPFKTASAKPVTIPEQRNTGIRAARRDIIVFTDAGCLPQAGWLDNLVAPLAAADNPRLSQQYGAAVADNPGKKQGEQIVAGATLSTGAQTFHDVVYHASAGKKYLDQAPTINLAVKKSVFQTVGLFDSSFLYGSDLDFTWRVRQAGIPIYNVQDARVTHDWGNLRQELKRARRYGQAKVRLYRKHQPGWRVFAQREFALIFYSLFLLGLPLALLWPAYLLLVLVPAAKNLYPPRQLVLAPVNIWTAAGALREGWGMLVGQMRKFIPAPPSLPAPTPEHKGETPRGRGRPGKVRSGAGTGSDGGVD